LVLYFYTKLEIKIFAQATNKLMINEGLVHLI
jgi:hypothetical protein